MRRYLAGLLAGTLLAAGLCAWLTGLRAADAPVAGNWKVVVLAGGQEIAVWLVQLEQKDGKTQGKLLATGHPNFKGSTLEATRADEQAVNLTFKVNDVSFSVVGHVPKGEKMPKKLLGSVDVRGQREFIQLERTDAKEIDPKDAMVEGPAFADLTKALNAREEKERTEGFQEVIKKFPDQPVSYVASTALLAQASRAGDEAAVRAHAERALKVAALHGPEIQLHAANQMVQMLRGNDKLAAVQLDYARRAERLLRDTDPATVQAPVLKGLVAALRKAGKADEAKPIEARIAKLEEQLDKEFLKDAIPFKPESFAGRKAKSDRAVVVELFTGAQCPPCVAADVAFDALLKTYRPAEVVLLQYHLHIPGPDPLTNKDSEKRSEFYGIEGTPAVFLNGKEGPAIGGGRQHARDRYDTLRKQLDQQLETDPQAKLKLTAQRKGDKIDMQADVADLKKTGDEVRLRFVIVEDLVRYAGQNGQRLHHQVVRALPGGVEGVAMKEKTGKHTASVSMAELSKSLTAYLEAYAKKEGFLDDERPLELKHLKVVALIQDNASKEVLQAAQVELKE